MTLPTPLHLAWLRLRECLEFEWMLPAKLAERGGLLAARALDGIGKHRSAFELRAAIHRGGRSVKISSVIASEIRQDIRPSSPRPAPLRRLLADHARTLRREPHSAKFFDDPSRLLGPTALVMKSPERNEPGVLNILYSYALPLFFRLFDIQRISKRYVIVLEPSWSGYCNADVLCYIGACAPVLVQAYEPRDHDFISALDSNLRPVAVSNNWWVDHRVFAPIPEIAKDVDIVMVAGWADFKRHHRFFDVVRRVKRRGRRLSVSLVGYPMQRTRDDIAKIAKYFGVLDQVDIFESISRAEVNRQLNRGKVNMVWSRKEGVNRAIIEGMFAGVPCLVRHGFNYGHSYDYINSSTGCYANDSNAPDVLVDIVDAAASFAPRNWVMANMTPQHATQRLSSALSRLSEAEGWAYGTDPVVKVNGLHGQDYWDESGWRTFAADYEFLASCQLLR